MGGQQDRPGRRGRTRLALRLVGGGLLIAVGAIHLDLYLTGYRSIPTIGWLFLLQVIAAFGLGAVVLVSAGSLTAAAGAVFALATLGGYLLSLWTGLFGFTEVRTTAGIAAGVIEVAAFAALAGLAAMPARRGRADGGPLAAPAGQAGNAQLVKRREWEFHLRLHAHGPQNPNARRRFDHMLHQRCLAGPRLSAHDKRPAFPATHGPEQPVQYLDLAAPAEQPLRRLVNDHRSTGERPYRFGG